jgi:regulator of replication initiation timing
MDIQNIKEVFELIIELIKKGATLEAQKKIMELEGVVISLQEENFNLRRENLSLRQQLELSEKGESCPKCRKGTWNLVGNEPHKIFGDMGVLERTFKCSECGYTEKKQYDTFESKS